MLRFGHGGYAARLIQDEALALPPCNLHLARELMARTRIHRLLEGCAGVPAADRHSIALTLVKISQLACDIAAIGELEINPLLADANGVLAVDVRIRVARATIPPGQRLAIQPYPRELEENLTLPDGQTLLLRPIRPEDEPLYQKLFARLSQEEILLRFLSPVRTLSHSLAARLSQIDYAREMALVLIGPDSAGEAELYGGARISADPGNERAEFAILLRGDMTGRGLGPMLLRRIIDLARNRGIKEVFGEVSSENQAMLKLCQVFGFAVKRLPDDPGVLHVTLKL
jgi:acetyltransferase